MFTLLPQHEGRSGLGNVCRARVGLCGNSCTGLSTVGSRVPRWKQCPRLRVEEAPGSLWTRFQPCRPPTYRFKASSAASHSGTAVRALGTPVSPLLMLMTFSHPIRGGIAAKGLGCQFCTARGWRRKAIWCRGVRDVSLRFAFVFFGAVESSRSETRDLSQTVC